MVSNKNDAQFLFGLGMDAQKWSDAFLDRFEGKILVRDINDLDENTEGCELDDLLGWFANAIMAGYDRGYWRGIEVNFSQVIADLQRTPLKPD